MLLDTHRDHKDCEGRGAQGDHLDFHTVLELCRNSKGLSSFCDTGRCSSLMSQ